MGALSSSPPPSSGSPLSLLSLNPACPLPIQPRLLPLPALAPPLLTPLPLLLPPPLRRRMLISWGGELSGVCGAYGRLQLPAVLLARLLAAWRGGMLLRFVDALIGDHASKSARWQPSRRPPQMTKNRAAAAGDPSGDPSGDPFGPAPRVCADACIAVWVRSPSPRLTRGRPPAIPAPGPSGMRTFFSSTGSGIRSKPAFQSAGEAWCSACSTVTMKDIVTACCRCCNRGCGTSRDVQP